MAACSKTAARAALSTGVGLRASIKAMVDEGKHNDAGAELVLPLHSTPTCAVSGAAMPLSHRQHCGRELPNHQRRPQQRTDEQGRLWLRLKVAVDGAASKSRKRNITARRRQRGGHQHAPGIPERQGRVVPGHV